MDQIEHVAQLPVATAEGPILDAMFLVASGLINSRVKLIGGESVRRFMYARSHAEVHRMMAPFHQQNPPMLNEMSFVLDRDGGGIVNVCASWAQCGPIMEFHNIYPQVNLNRKTSDDMFVARPLAEPLEAYGPTAMVAVIRAFVLNKVGEIVQVPLWLK